MVGIISFYEDLVPLTRHRCVESPHPTSCSPIKSWKLGGLMVSPYCALFCYSLCGRMISALLTLSEASKPISLGLRRAGSPTWAPKWIMRQIQIYQAITTAQILRYIKAAGTFFTVPAAFVYTYSAVI